MFSQGYISIPFRSLKFLNLASVGHNPKKSVPVSCVCVCVRAYMHAYVHVCFFFSSFFLSFVP